MADQRLKEKIHATLKRAFFSGPDDLVDVSDGANGNIHLVVVSRKFDDHGVQDNEELLWSLLTKNFTPEEWGKITLSVAASPEDIKAI